MASISMPSSSIFEVTGAAVAAFAKLVRVGWGWIGGLVTGAPVAAFAKLVEAGWSWTGGLAETAVAYL